MLGKTIKRIVLGFFIGAVVGNAITALVGLTGQGAFAPVTQTLTARAGGLIGALLLQTLFSGLYGAIAFAAIFLYDLERLPLALSSVLHCAVIVLTFVPVSLLMGWTSGVREALFMAGAQIVGYFLIWVVLFFIYRAQARKLNDIKQQHSDPESQEEMK